jgi:hypothetical protein
MESLSILYPLDIDQNRSTPLEAKSWESRSPPHIALLQTIAGAKCGLSGADPPLVHENPG